MHTTVPELLAPAGGPAQFGSALAAGADAVYCGFGTTFNARRGAQSFDSASFEHACVQAHVVGARVYVTVNVAIRDDEMPVALALVRRAYLLGADAFIVQDWGLLAEIARRWPEVECHLSTQANVHDARGVLWAAARGAMRVTLSRELSREEIARLAETGVELESFCHGAICICYSGVCSMSSCAGERSANRGTCAQPCRLPYDLQIKDGTVLSRPGWGRPLCPRDFYSLDDLSELVSSGVCSLKVEGRLKGPEYLASVIPVYRAQLDDLAAGRTPTRAESERRHTQLRRAFNRDFTNAYLHGRSGNELMSYERSNNRGELVGTVVGARSYGSVKVRAGGGSGGRDRVRTKRVAQTDVYLDKPVGKGDLLEIRPLGDPTQFLTATVDEDCAAGQTLTCKTVRPMEKGSQVRVIRSQAALDAGARTAQLEVPRKREVSVCIRARIGEPLRIELATLDGSAQACAAGDVVEPARTRAVTRADLVEHVGRMGSSRFEPREFVVDMDEGCGMAFSAVHALRAEACEMLEQAILRVYRGRELSPAPSREALRERSGSRRAVRDADVAVCALVTSPEAARAAFEAGAGRVYATADALCDGVWPKQVIPLLDEVCREADHERLDAWVRTDRAVAVGNVSELALAQERGAAAEVRGCIPVHNGSCLRALVQAGAAGVWLSPELSLEEIRVLGAQASVPLGALVLGRVRAMTCEHCVLQVADRCLGDCVRCALRREQTYLRNEVGDLFPVRTDAQGRSRVYAARPLDLTPYLRELTDAGVCWFGADCTLLSPVQTAEAVRRVVRALDAVREGVRPPRRLDGSVAGHLFAPIA